MRDILGGKGAGLAEMANLGLPVPPGFTISAKLCLTYLERGTFPDGLREEVARHLKQLEHATKRKFGSRDQPLLVSVRSGAAVSRRGMMETILTLGLNDETVQGLVADSKNPNFAYDSYRRFVHMYGDVVFDLGRQPFAEVLEECKRRRKVERDIDLPPDELQALVRESKAIVQAKAGVPFPDDPMQQLWGAIEAVFRSPRARGPEAGAALQGRAGHRVHLRARQALHAADQARPAHRARRRPHRRGHGGRWPDHRG